jgi:hypothetical protein
MFIYNIDRNNNMRSNFKDYGVTQFLLANVRKRQQGNKMIKHLRNIQKNKSVKTSQH